SALQMAISNAKKNDLADRFSTLQSDWFEHVTGRYDLIVSNPPYIATDVLPLLEPEVVRFDPALALDGGADGLDAYRQILANGRDYLVEEGILALEIGHDQRHCVSQLASANGWKVTQTARDLAGCDRALCLR
ncbi:MAG: HemK/PrmC family methyltransferase, partial [Marinomonas sp.]